MVKYNEFLSRHQQKKAQEKRYYAGALAFVFMTVITCLALVFYHVG